MDLGLNGKVAMVAAASKGIGYAIGKMLHDEGCQVSICARNEETLEAAAAEIGGETRSYVVDVANEEDLAWWHEQTVADLGVPQILVTNTGGPPAGALDDKTVDEWQLGFESTVLNVVRMSGLVLPGMKAAGWGRIVHVTSLVAKEPSLMLPISSTLRAGLMALTRVQATEYAPFGITVNAVLPGHTMTDRQIHLAELTAAKDGITVEEALKRRGESIPTGRLATAEEVAAAAVFLASVPAASITGTNLLVDGGSTKGLA